MEHSNEKCVMVINAELPLGLIANTAGILGVTLGKLAPQIVGEDVVDQSGNSHRGVVAIPIPILSVSREKLKMIREQLYQPEFSDLIVVDLQKPHLQPIHDLVSNLVYCGKASDIDTVVVDGRIVVENRRVAGVDLPKLYADVAAAVERITGR